MRRLNVSISDEDGKFLEENTDLSPSKMLQSKIHEIKNNRSYVFAEIARLQKVIIFMEKQIQKLNLEKDENGLE